MTSEFLHFTTLC